VTQGSEAVRGLSGLVDMVNQFGNQFQVSGLATIINM
jgi:hypothetical protein